MQNRGMEASRKSGIEQIGKTFLQPTPGDLPQENKVTEPDLNLNLKDSAGVGLDRRADLSYNIKVILEALFLIIPFLFLPRSGQDFFPGCTNSPEKY